MGDPSAAHGHVSAIPAPAQSYQGRRAGVVTRCAASGIDFLVVSLVVAVIYGAIAAIAFLLDPSNFRWPPGLGWSVPVVGTLIAFPYLTVCWQSTGRTYGATLLGLRVVNFRGERLTVVGAAARAILSLLFPIGLLWVAVSRANRSVQDVLLRTSVIYDWAPRPLRDRRGAAPAEVTLPAGDGPGT